MPGALPSAQARQDAGALRVRRKRPAVPAVRARAATGSWLNGLPGKNWKTAGSERAMLEQHQEDEMRAIARTRPALRYMRSRRQASKDSRRGPSCAGRKNGAQPSEGSRRELKARGELICSHKPHAQSIVLTITTSGDACQAGF